MPYLYGVSDTKFVKGQQRVELLKPSPLVPKFERGEFFAGKINFNRNDAPRQFRVSPDRLLELCVGPVNSLPVTSVFDWTENDICNWIKNYGYPHYRNTFRVNMITGRKLLLLDASALAAMNIKDFDHIKHIARGVRMLFHFELAKFGRSISLPPESYYELYKLFRVKSAMDYEKVRRSDLWSKLRLIRKKQPNLSHWELLENWMQRKTPQNDIVAYTPRYRLYCNPPYVVEEKAVSVEEDDSTTCQTDPSTGVCTCCMPPCICNWGKRELRQPWTLPTITARVSTVKTHTGKVELLSSLIKQEKCTKCIPPCECQWLCRFYNSGTVLTCLQDSFPEKFAPVMYEETRISIRDSILQRWTRFSY